MYKDGFKVDPKNIKSISSWSTLKNATGVRRFLILLCYYGIFVKGFSNIEYHLSWGKSSNFIIIVITLTTMETLIFKILSLICWYDSKFHTSSFIILSYSTCIYFPCYLECEASSKDLGKVSTKESIKAMKFSSYLWGALLILVDLLGDILILTLLPLKKFILPPLSQVN